MKKNVTKFIVFFCSCVLLAAILFVYSNSNNTTSQQQIKQKLEDPNDKLSKVETKKARYEYFFQKLRDPVTNSIPRNIRSREIQYAKTLPSASQVNEQIKAKNPAAKLAPEFSWSLAGPPATGGRTRALGIDQRDPNVIIAGGVSGGIWKSTDGGNSWELKTADAESFSVTKLVQDPTDLDTWYYTSGEFIGNTPGATGAPYFGSGVFVSTNNGETWSRFQNAGDNDNSFNSPYDFISDIVVNPSTGSIFIAGNLTGIYRSTDTEPFPADDPTPQPILGEVNGPFYSSLAVTSDGSRIAAILSTQNAGETTYTPGLHISTDDGDSWQAIDIPTLPSDHGRSVLAFAPSNPDILYIFTHKIDDETNQGISFHMVDLSAGLNNVTSEDRSSNLPDFGEPVGGVNTQGGYNMAVSVKPDDPNFVLVGATNLFRSTDGFATAPANDSESEKDEFWIGGYAKANNISQYADHHVDQHVIAYDPTNVNRMWNGNDGGVYVTNDVTANEVSWNDRNEGYITTQFYAAAIPSEATDNRFMGGTQDNGTPFFNTDNPSPDQTFDISSGDGGYSFFTENHLFVSSQQGRVIRWNSSLTDLQYVFPSGVNREEVLFINPYTIDPNDENIMYYADVDHIWRNTSLDQVNDGNSSASNGTSVGWNELNSVNVPTNYTITALTSSSTPANILYYAGYNSDGQPAIRKLDNANTATSPTSINLPDNSSLNGAYVNNIAVSSINGNEAMVILSNYNVPSIWHTSDGGNSWENVEGNLSVQSIRSATMIPADGGTVYVVGTSTGIYSTQQLNGTNTDWGQEGENELGFSVTEQIVSRQSNGDVAAGTHGRGMFKGAFQGSTSFPFISASPGQARSGETITLSAINFEFSPNASENTVLFRALDIQQTNFCQTLTIESVAGEVISATASSIEVRVPRGVLPDECAVSNSATVTVSVQGQSPDPSPTSFRVLPPNSFTLQQNYPNPFNPTTTIPIDLAVDSRVTLAIYDMLGQKVMEPVFEDEFIAGTFNTTVDLSNLASGVYIYRVVATPTSGNGETFVESRKMTLVK